MYGSCAGCTSASSFLYSFARFAFDCMNCVSLSLMESAYPSSLYSYWLISLCLSSICYSCVCCAYCVLYYCITAFSYSTRALSSSISLSSYFWL